jgi:hypothetical protein
MKNYYLRLKDVDFTYTDGQWVSGIVDLYDNEAIASMATPSYVNYSTTRSAYGTNLLGNDIWTGLNILDDSASPNIVTDSGYVKDGRFVDTTGRINVTTWDISYNNFSANDVTALISFYYTDLSTLNFPDEWPSIDAVPLNRGIYLPNTPRYGRIVLDLTSEKDLSSISFDLYVKVLIDKPVITPLYDRTVSILRKFPEWMEIRRDSEPSATPSLATPTTLAGSFINAVAGEWLDDLINDVGYLQLQSFIETSDVAQLDWVYITNGIPDKIVQVIGDGTILSRAFDTIEFSKSKEDDDLFYLDQSTNTIYVRKYYQILTIDDTRFNQSLSQVWNWFDEHGLSVDLERHTGETNDSFKKRILDVYKNKPGVGLEAFKLALRRELNLWLYEGATPDSAFLGATPEVLEMSDILSDPLHVTPDGLPTDKLVSLIDYMAATYPTTWGYFKWDQAYWDIDGEGSKGYGVLPYRYDPDPLADSDTQSGVGDDMDLFLYAPDAITGPREFDLSVTARGFTKTHVDDYLPIEMAIDVFGRAEKTVYVVPEEDFWLNFKATMEDGKIYRSSIWVDRSGATPNTTPSYFDFTTSIPVVDTNRLQPYLNWFDIEEQKYTGTAITSMKAKLADITGSYVFQMPRGSIYGSINPDIQEGKSVTLYSGESYIFGTIEEISQSSDLYVDDINLFDYIKISDIVYNGDLTSSRWTIPNYLNLLTGDATPVFSLDTLEAGFGLYDFSPSSAIQSTEYQYFLYDHASPVSDKYYAVFGFESGSLNSATPTILDDNELIFHRSNSEIKGNVYYTDTDPDDSTFVGITSSSTLNSGTATVGSSQVISLSPNNNPYSIGDKIRITRTAEPTQYYEGVITAKGSSTSTTLTITAKVAGFFGAYSSWTISPIWDDAIVVAAKSLAVADGYQEYIILEMSSVSGDWTPNDGWEIWPSGFHGVDSYPSGDLSLYVSDKLNHSTPSDYIDADSATPGTYLDTDLRAFQEFVVGVNGSTTLTDYKWVSDSQTFLVSVNSGVSVSSTSSWSADVPEVIWDQYITSEGSKELVVELLTVNDDGDYGAMVPYYAGSYGSGVVPAVMSNIFIPKENIYVNGSNSWVNIDTGGGESYAIILPATETSIEITVDETGLTEYPLQKIKYIPFESTIANIESGVVDENGPWRDGTKPSGGLNNYAFTTLEVDRNDFGIANSEDSIVTWIGVSTNNDRVISWLDQNTVEPSFSTEWASATSYPLDSITEIDDGSGLFYYSPFVVRVKMKSEVNPQWNPQMHSGWFYDRNDEYYFYVDPIEEVASPGSEGATFSDFYTEKVPRQGAPILVKALSSTPVEMRQVSFFDNNINLSLKNTQYVYGTGTEKLYLAYENIYDATVSDYTSGQLIIGNGYSNSNEIDVNQETLTDHVYEVSYKLRDSFIVDNEYFTANGAQRAKITFDSTPSGATPFSIVYESSVFDPATPIDIPLNPFYTTVDEGFVFISLNEYEASTPVARVSPGILVANGTDYAIVSIYSVDNFGNPKPNQSYTVSTTFGTFDSTGTNTAPITTDRDGFAWLTLTSEEGSNVEVATITVAGDFTSELNLEIEARKAEQYKLHALADPTAIPADGLSATSVYGKVLNEDGNPVPYAYVSYKKGRSVYEIFTNNNSTPDVGPSSSPAATPIWPDSGRVTADSSGVFRIGPFVSATPNMPGYWFVSTESYSSSPSGGETWEAVGDVVFWREYPPKFRSVNGENQSIPTSQNLNIEPRIYLDESGRLVIEPLIPPPATVNAFPTTFDEETPTADATPVTNTWSPAKWYAINLYEQYQRGMLGDDFYVFKIENLPQIHPDYRDV